MDLTLRHLGVPSRDLILHFISKTRTWASSLFTGRDSKSLNSFWAVGFLSWGSKERERQVSASWDSRRVGDVCPYSWPLTAWAPPRSALTSWFFHPAATNPAPTNQGLNLRKNLPKFFTLLLREGTLTGKEPSTVPSSNFCTLLRAEYRFSCTPVSIYLFSQSDLTGAF